MQDSGTMPLISEIILGVSVGCVEIRQVRMTKNNEPQEVNVLFFSLEHLAFTDSRTSLTYSDMILLMFILFFFVA